MGSRSGTDCGVGHRRNADLGVVAVSPNLFEGKGRREKRKDSAPG